MSWNNLYFNFYHYIAELLNFVSVQSCTTVLSICYLLFTYTNRNLVSDYTRSPRITIKKTEIEVRMMHDSEKLNAHADVCKQISIF
jgi:hypothetical protein